MLKCLEYIPLKLLSNALKHIGLFMLGFLLEVWNLGCFPHPYAEFDIFDECEHAKPSPSIYKIPLAKTFSVILTLLNVHNSV